MAWRNVKVHFLILLYMWICSQASFEVDVNCWWNRALPAGHNVSVVCHTSARGRANSCDLCQLYVISPGHRHLLPRACASSKETFNISIATKLTGHIRCMCNGNTTDTCNVTVRGGYPPSSPSRPDCAIRSEEEDIYCSWTKSNEPMIPTNYTLHWQEYDGKVNSIESDEENAVINRVLYMKSSDITAWVTAKNVLGSARSEESVFNTGHIILPDPPSIITHTFMPLVIYWNMSLCESVGPLDMTCQVQYQAYNHMLDWIQPSQEDPQSVVPTQDPHSAGPLRPNQDPQSACPPLTSVLPDVSDGSEKTMAEEFFSPAYLAGVPQSTPVKPHSIQSSREHERAVTPKLLLKLSSPHTAEPHSRSSTSGTYYAVSAAKFYQRVEQTHDEDSSEDLNLDVSMLSLDPPSDKKDQSFVPLSSTSTSTPTTEEEEDNGKYKERKWMVNESSLMELFCRCNHCGASVIETKKNTCGSLMQVNWECSNGHQGKWNSCDEIRGMPINNLLVAACTLFTGATYTDIDDWAALLNLQIPKKTSFYAIQSSYLIPVVDIVYKEKQEQILEGLRMQNFMQKGVHLSGDGRSDSPGFSAKYCTYSLMDDSTSQVVDFELVQVTEASSSVAMEPIGFRRGLNSILEKGIDIKVVTTDRSPSIRKLMRVDYPQIHHEFDIWHVVKGFFKKLLSVSKKKENNDLQPWIKSICNHLWYACASCSGEPNVLTEKWKSLLHHICGVHSWEEDGQQHQCAHDDLTPDQQRRKRWIRKDSPAFRTLSSLVLHVNLMKDLRQMALFKHTGSLEVYHSVLLKYCRKNLHFHYSSMTARTQLAVLDHNENVHRQQATTTSGVPRYNVVYPKQTKEWLARKIYEPTTQNFRDELVHKVLQRRSDPTVVFKDPTSQISFPEMPCNIAKKTKPDKEAAVAKHVSRFQK